MVMTQVRATAHWLYVCDATLSDAIPFTYTNRRTVHAFLWHEPFYMKNFYCVFPKSFYAITLLYRHSL
jgi:hypothetical protein